MSTLSFLFGLHAMQYVWGGSVAIRSGNKALPFGFALGVLFMYTWFTPWFLWINKEDTIARIPYGPYLPEALGVYVLGVGIFIAAWQVLPQGRTLTLSWLPTTKRGLKPVWVLLLLYLLFFIIGLRKAGIPLDEWVTYSNSNKYLNLFGMHWPNPLVDKVADGLVTLGLLVLCVDVAWGAAVAAPLLVLFSLLGFRYRHLLMMGSWLVILFHRASSVKARIRLGTWLLVGCIGLAWLTLNRIRISQRFFGELDYNLTHFDLRLLANETNNSQTFRVLLGFYHTNNLSADGLLATPTFIAVRAIPASFFSDGVKPKPPLLVHLKEAYIITRDAARLHPAVSNIEEYYLGYGIWGVVVGMCALAWLCRWLGSQKGVVAGLGTVFLFQLISRGYLPQQVDLAFFLALPLVLLYLWHKLSQRREASPISR